MKKTDILKIWKNKKKILEGIKNSIITKESIEQVANVRMAICNKCPHIDNDGTSCLMPGTQPCCGLCGCNLKWKTRSLSSACDDNRWDALTDEETEEQVKNNLNLEY